MNAPVTFAKVKLPNGWLGNMAPYPVHYDGQQWPTTEHLFQALRFTDPNIREIIRQIPSPMGAKLHAKSMPDTMAIQPLSEQDLDNMRLCLRLKIEQHPELKTALVATGDAIIIEDVTSRQNRPGNHLFWGMALQSDGTWKGTNTLGNLWMELRHVPPQEVNNP